MAKGLMISRADIVKNTHISGSVDIDKYIQFILIAQEITIQQLLGTDLYEKIQTDIENSTLSGNYLTLVTEYVKPVLIHAGFLNYLPFAAYTIGNQGIFKKSAENAENVDKSEVDYLVEKERDIMQFYIDRLIEHLTFEASSKYPEYNTNTNDAIHPLQGGINYEGWIL